MTEPLSAEEVRSLRSEAESERDHPNKRHATWQQLVLRLLATVDREAEARRDLEQRLERLDDAANEAELDAPEEARRFSVPFEGGFREGARWALNRWRAALAPHDATATPGEET